MRKLLPLLLALVGLGGGIGAGLALKPAPEPGVETHAEAGGGTAEESADHVAASPEAGEHAAASGETTEGGPEFVRLNNQFVVPVVSNGRVSSLVVMSISLQVGAGARETVFAREPKLRDSFLQVLFDHANAGGFNGMFTTADNLRTLRMALLEAAQKALGDLVTDVLIIDLVRQDT